MVKQTAGRDALNDFAPKFAELNDDVLFGEVWSREGQLPLKLTRASRSRRASARASRTVLSPTTSRPRSKTA